MTRLDARMSNLRSLLEDASIEHFSAEELVRHDHPDWPHPTLYPPPERMHEHIVPTLEIADEIRSKWGGPVIVASGYRAPSYNDFLIEGSDRSQHMHFRALDLRPSEGSIRDFIGLVDDVVTKRRSNGQVIGFGRYASFCHIDTGYYDHQRDWDRR